MSHDPDDAARQLVEEAFQDYAQRRLDSYERVKIEQLLSKDVVMFAIRGVRSPDQFVEEAFSARDSSSEETTMGNTWQRIAAQLARSAVEAGDLWATRGNELWVVEIKTQPNTLNFGGLADAITRLRQQVAGRERVHRATAQKVLPMIGVLRGPEQDTWKTFVVPPERPEYAQLNNFEYRYLVGRAFWRWLTDRPSIISLLPDLQTSGLSLAAARHAALNRLKSELGVMLDERLLPRTMESVLQVADELLASDE